MSWTKRASSKRSKKPSSKKVLKSWKSLGADNRVIPVPKAAQRQTRQFLHNVGTSGILVGAPAWNQWTAGAQVADAFKIMNSSPKWTYLATMYDQFRPVRMRLKYVPDRLYTTSQGWSIPAIVAFDADGAMPATPNASVLAQYGTAKLVSLAEEFELVYDIPLPANGAWYDMGVPSAWLAQIGLVQVSNGTSTQGSLGAWLVELDLLVRGGR